MRFPDRSLDRSGRLTAREKKAEVTITLGQRLDGLANRDGDLETLYIRHLECRFGPSARV